MSAAPRTSVVAAATLSRAAKNAALAARCVARVLENRAALARAHRGEGGASPALRQIIMDEMAALGEAGCAAARPAAPGGGSGGGGDIDVDVDVDVAAAAAAAAADTESDDDAGGLTADEHIELLLRLERALFESDAAAQWDDLCAAEDAEAASLVARYERDEAAAGAGARS
jgi:hypothetical protein